jgi:pimeloyl-ACP methyl ester carboxylesterase
MAIERATMGRLPSAALGAGPAVAVLAGLSPTTGVDGDWIVRGTLGPVANLSRAHRVVLFNRRPHLPRGMSMAELAAEQADAIREGLTPPVDVIGMSTGGSLALQLAADHPDVVRRLVVISAACRLGPKGKRLQRRVAARIRAGAPRQALALLASDLVPAGRGQTVAAGMAWLIGPTVIKDPLDLDDMATTIEAEDTFDLAECPTIRTPTLILAGANDRFYPQRLLQETAALIPGSELILLEGRGHITALSDKRFGAALERFFH